MALSCVVSKTFNVKKLVPWGTDGRLPLSDPNPGFKVAVFLKVEYLKNGAF